MAYFDAHAHLTSPRFANDLDEVLERSRAVGIDGWVLGGTDPEEWARQAELVQKFPQKMIPVYGLHPWHVAKISPAQLKADLSTLRKALPLASGLGELGLDHGRKVESSSRPQQLEALRAQLVLAQELNLPIVLHIVSAEAEVLQELGKLSGSWRGYVHAFQGDLSSAEAFISLGLKLSFGGAIARSQAEGLRAVVSQIPGDAILVESDAPDQIPYQFSPPQAGRNEPCVVPWLADKIAVLRGERADLVLERSSQSIREIFVS